MLNSLNTATLFSLSPSFLWINSEMTRMRSSCFFLVFKLWAHVCLGWVQLKFPECTDPLFMRDPEPGCMYSPYRWEITEMFFFRSALIGNIFMLTTCFNRIENYRFFCIVEIYCSFFAGFSSFRVWALSLTKCLMKFHACLNLFLSTFLLRLVAYRIQRAIET